LLGNEFVLKHSFLHFTSYILHLFLSDTSVGFMSYTRRNDDFSFLTVHVCTRVKKHLAYLADPASRPFLTSRWSGAF
jgi:hypothetical protein